MQNSQNKGVRNGVKIRFHNLPAVWPGEVTLLSLSPDSLGSARWNQAPTEAKTEPHSTCDHWPLFNSWINSWTTWSLYQPGTLPEPITASFPDRKSPFHFKNTTSNCAWILTNGEYRQCLVKQKITGSLWQRGARIRPSGELLQMEGTQCIVYTLCIVYTVHTVYVHTVYTLYIVYTSCIVYIVHTVYIHTMYSVHTMFSVHTVYSVHHTHSVCTHHV